MDNFIRNCSSAENHLKGTLYRLIGNTKLFSKNEDINKCEFIYFGRQLHKFDYFCPQQGFWNV